MKETWYRIIELGYVSSPWKMWEDRHVKVTIGENRIESIYYLFNKESEIIYVEFDEDSDFSTQIELKKSFKDITLGNSVLLGVCGKFEIIGSENKDELKIEYL